MSKNKAFLITGGTGSFGNAVLCRFLDFDTEEMRIFSRDGKKQDDVRHHLQGPKVKFYIGDVCDGRSVDDVMLGVGYIFHAAALRRVLSREFFLTQTVGINTLDTGNVLNLTIAHKVGDIVVLSTDKTCYPVNTMGINKAMMERVAITKGKQLGESAPTTIHCTRHSNMMVSRGLVTPLQIGQMEAGGDITITSPYITRSMMTLNDTVDLVICVLQHGHNEGLFVQKTPTAVLEVLAEALQQLYELKTRVHMIDVRHGEKPYESLVAREEMVKAENMGNYYRTPCGARDLSYDEYFMGGQRKVTKFEDYHPHNTHRLDVEGMKQLLLKLNIIKGDVCLR